ncbi:MAG: hypothetical protein HY782_18500 [Chloroflexi bacterium]|nr:hypothetical protein [Chloroflexota bacterium]
MGRILLLIVLLGGSSLFLSNGFGELGDQLDVLSIGLRDPDAPFDSASFLFGLSLAASVGFLVFRCTVWGGHATDCFHERPASLRPGPSSMKTMGSSLGYLLGLAGVLLTVAIVALEYEGQHELIVQAWELVSTKAQRLIEVLTR